MASIQEAFAAALRLFEAGNVAEAEQICRQILAVDANSASAWSFLGIIELKQGRHREAAEHIRNAITLQPQWAEAYNNLGLVLHAQGKLEEAATLYRRAAELDPNFAMAHQNLGLTISGLGRPGEAIEHYCRAISLRPGYAHAHVNLGNALKMLGKLQEAAAEYETALAAKPDFAEAEHNLASVCLAQGQYMAALEHYERAVELEPDFAEAHKNLSQLRLLLEDFERGWSECEWRWKTGELPSPACSQPRWNGEPLTGKTILLIAEQGLGDTIQFIRYATLVAKRSAKVFLQCPPVLLPLVRTCSYVDAVFGTNDHVPAVDYHVPLLSLPGIFRTNLQSIPAEIPYLSANEALVERWKSKLDPNRGFRIGINWQGRAVDDDFRLRDMPLELFAKLSDVAGVGLISLQKEGGQNQLRATRGLPIVDLGEDFDESAGAFMDTAAIMKNLDLVITSDTSIAHLAGALGVPVWVGLPFVPNWRWLLNRSDSPWYPTMRLFRQQRRGDWDGVVAEMRSELAAMVR